MGMQPLTGGNVSERQKTGERHSSSNRRLERDTLVSTEGWRETQQSQQKRDTLVPTEERHSITSTTSTCRSTQHLHSIYTASTQHLHSVYTAFTQRALTVSNEHHQSNVITV